MGVFAVALLITNAIFAANPATIDKTRTGSITLYKYEQAGEMDNTMSGTGMADQNIPEGSKPLPGVEFTIWKVTNDTTDPAEAIVDNNKTWKGTTGNDGKILFDNLEQGLYLVRETKAPVNVYEKTPDFLVHIPMTVTVTTNGEEVDQWLYDITVYPKNQTVYGSVILNKVDGAGERLQGAAFSLYVWNVEDGKPLEEGTLGDLYDAKNFVTDEDGQLVVEGLPVGKYAFVETKAPAGFGIDPTPHVFEITSSGEVVEVDGIFEAGNDATVELEVVNDKTPNIHKGVKSPTNQHSGYDMDEKQTWVVAPEVPYNIENYTKYIVKDTIDERLDFVSDSLEVYVDGTWTDDANGVAGTYTPGTKLTQGVDYTYSYDTVSRTWTVTFIDDKNNPGNAALEGKSNVYIMFNTKFNDKAQLGDAIPNTSELTFNNGFMTEDQTKESETPEVHTGGISFWKYAIISGAETPLAGAEFKIAASEADANAGNFITNENGSVLVGVSDANGIVKFEGLAYGLDNEGNEVASTDYWIVETKSPVVDGVKYNLLDAPVKVTIDKDSHVVPDELSSASFDVEVLNKTGIQLPTTGGIGTIIFTALGVLLMGFAVVLFTKSSKSEKVEKVK